MLLTPSTSGAGGPDLHQILAGVGMLRTISGGQMHAQPMFLTERTRL